VEWCENGDEDEDEDEDEVVLGGGVRVCVLCGVWGEWVEWYIKALERKSQRCR